MDAYSMISDDYVIVNEELQRDSCQAPLNLSGRVVRHSSCQVRPTEIQTNRSTGLHSCIEPTGK
jgi:hypothetical protein